MAVFPHKCYEAGRALALGLRLADPGSGGFTHRNVEPGYRRQSYRPEEAEAPAGAEYLTQGSETPRRKPAKVAPTETRTQLPCPVSVRGFLHSDSSETKLCNVLATGLFPFSET